MYIYCKGLCHVCQNPLDIFVKCRNYETKELIRKYRKIRPIWLHNNYKYYKFFGLKVKNVCNYCFKNFKKPSISELKGREICSLYQKRWSFKNRKRKPIHIIFINKRRYITLVHRIRKLRIKKFS